MADGGKPRIADDFGAIAKRLKEISHNPMDDRKSGNADYSSLLDDEDDDFDMLPRKPAKPADPSVICADCGYSNKLIPGKHVCDYCGHFI